VQLEHAHAACSRHEHSAAEAEAQLEDCRQAAAVARQAVADSDAAVEEAVDEVTDAEEVRIRCRTSYAIVAAVLGGLPTSSTSSSSRLRVSADKVLGCSAFWA